MQQSNSASRGWRGARRWFALAVIAAGVIVAAGTPQVASTMAILTDSQTAGANTVTTTQVQPPTALTVTRPATASVLSWTQTPSTFATGYNIYAAASTGGPFALVGTVSGRGTTTWTDPEPTRHRNTTYVVTALAYNWFSGNSNESAGVGQSYSSTVIGDGPLGYWRLGEASGASVLADSSGNNRPASRVGAATLGQPSLLGTNTDTSMTVDGSGSGASVPFNAAFNASTLTVEMWIKTPSATGQAYRALFTKDATLNNTAREFNLYAKSDDNVRVSGLYLDSMVLGRGDVTLAAPLPPNTVHHLVASATSGISRFYIDGVEQPPLNSWSKPTGLAFSSAGLSIGYGDASLHWTGGVDEVAFYSKLLTPAQVRAHYRAGTTPTQALEQSYAQQVGADRPLGFWRLGEAAGAATLFDATTGRRNASVSGTVALGQPSTVSTTSNTSAVFQSSSASRGLVPYDSAMSTNTVTVEMWIRTPANFAGVGAWRGLAVRANGIYRDYNFYAYSADGVNVTGLHMASTYLGASSATLSAPLAPNTVHHVAFTSNVGTQHYYLDGVEQPVTTVHSGPGAGSMSTQAFNIGAGDDPSWPWNGGIDEIALYNTVLSPTQMANHWNAGSQVPQNVQTAATPTDLTVRWDPPPVDDAYTGYRVYRGTTPQSMIAVGTVSGPVRRYTDGGMGAGTYYYSVAAITPAGEGARSAPVPVTTAQLTAGPPTWSTPGYTDGGLEVAELYAGTLHVHGWGVDCDNQALPTYVELFATPSGGGASVYLGRMWTGIYDAGMESISSVMKNTVYDGYVASPGSGTWTIKGQVADTVPTATNQRYPIINTIQVTIP